MTSLWSVIKVWRDFQTELHFRLYVLKQFLVLFPLYIICVSFHSCSYTFPHKCIVSRCFLSFCVFDRLFWLFVYLCIFYYVSVHFLLRRCVCLTNNWQIEFMYLRNKENRSLLQHLFCIHFSSLILLSLLLSLFIFGTSMNNLKGGFYKIKLLKNKNI